MKYSATLISLLFYLFINSITLDGQAVLRRQWPSFRGYMSSGVLDSANLPASFDPGIYINIKWKAEIPGLGLSSPVIWDKFLFITTAVSDKDKSGFKTGIYGDIEPVDDASMHEWKVLCFDKNSGKMLWERTACKGIPKMKRHPKSTHANCSVATNGKYVVAFFGSEGLYCYDMSGNLIWQKSFGLLKSVFFAVKDAEWEFASSPVIFNNVLVIQCDVLENSFVATFDVKSGKELWRTQREEYPGWCTPNIYMSGGKAYIALNGYKRRAGYDLQTGREIWSMSGGGDIQIPTPIIGDGLIYFNSAHGSNSPILAVSTSAKGDITLKNNETSNEYIKWSIPRGGSYMHTMLLYRNRLYNVNWNGTVNCYNPTTGAEIYTAKLGRSKSFIASPVASDGRIYIVDEEGTVYIIADGDKFRQLDEIPLRDECLSAPALTDGEIIFRTRRYLIAAGSSH
jgi:outer membrane protein assembly factor BamB